MTTDSNIFRWYRAVWGRYTQPDPAGLNGGVNEFQFVDGNPVAFADPLGLLAVSYEGRKNADIMKICKSVGALGCAVFEGERNCECGVRCGVWHPHATFKGSVKIYFSTDCYDTSLIILEEERHIAAYESDFASAQKKTKKLNSKSFSSRKDCDAACEKWRSDMKETMDSTFARKFVDFTHPTKDCAGKTVW